MIKCPYCKSTEVLSCGFDDEAMELWKCSNCQETFARCDLLLDDSDDEVPAGEVGLSDSDAVGPNDDDPFRFTPEYKRELRDE